MPMAALELRAFSDDDGVRLEPLGELDLATAEQFDDALRAWLEDPRAGELVVDLSGVTFMDSTGLRSVLIGSSAANQAGRRMVVVPGRGQARRVIELAQVSAYLELRDLNGDDA